MAIIKLSPKLKSDIHIEKIAVESKCMLEHFEIALRIILGLQMTFWGLNGFFNWIEIPPVSPVIDRFVQACIDSGIIMPTVKLVEIIFGALLVLGVYTVLSLIALGPIMFVITCLHFRNNPRAWTVLAPICIPYAALLLLHQNKFIFLFQSF